MAAFFTLDPLGADVRYRSEADIAGTNPVPPGAAYVRRFDEMTNPGLVSAWQANSQAFAMPGGTVTQGGVPVTFQPDGPYFAALLRAPQLLAKVRGSSDPFSREELADLFAVAFHAAGLLD